MPDETNQSQSEAYYPNELSQSMRYYYLLTRTRSVMNRTTSCSVHSRAISITEQMYFLIRSIGIVCHRNLNNFFIRAPGHGVH